MKNLSVEIDSNSGFCFGVVNAIKQAEKQLLKEDDLLCIGEIVHNDKEVERLNKKGLKTINHKEFSVIKDKTVMLRAHGEPPETYKIAKANNIKLIDASCPIVLRLQKKVHKAYLEAKKDNGQILIYGKKGHAEVIGLLGQTNNEAIVLENIMDLSHVDFNRPIVLFSQTTKTISGFIEISNIIKEKSASYIINDTICRQVSNRVPHIKKMANNYDVIIFVSGTKSSNGKLLFEQAKLSNKRTHMVSKSDELKTEWFNKNERVGISGATSTPAWLMVEVSQKIKNF